MVHRPDWFTDGKVFVCYAETVGINAKGNTLFVVDPKTGKRTDVIDDRVLHDVETLLADPAAANAAAARWVSADDFTVAVPDYYDARHTEPLTELLDRPEFSKFTARSVGELIRDKQIIARAGHGSPSVDLRGGTIPYVKVSDLRAGQVNINPSNRVTTVVAEKFWRGTSSGLRAFDLITPVRASKNIGEFALLMPGQERVVLTKEMLILRPTATSLVDSFYLFWAMSLRAVREQWRKIIFMQTNREDVGSRYLEILIPWPDTKQAGHKVSDGFRTYYQGVEKLRTKFVEALAETDLHHTFLSVAEESEDDPADDSDSDQPRDGTAG